MKRAIWGAVLLAAVGVSNVAGAVQPSTTVLGRAFMGGGVTDDERAEMKTQRDRYSLWVLTAARKSGAYLSNVQIHITDVHKAVVFDAPIDGPWLFVDLPPGPFTVQATYHGETQSRMTHIRAGDHRQAIFYFETGDTTSVSSEAKQP